MDPHAAWLLLRGIKTVAVRVQRQNESALRWRSSCRGTPRCGQVHLSVSGGASAAGAGDGANGGGGGVLSFEVEGSAEDARRVSEALNLFTLAPSLGGVDSLVCLPALTSHAMIPAEHRQKMGITDQLIRLSVGIEHVDDLIADLEQGLAVVQYGPGGEEQFLVSSCLSWLCATPSNLSSQFSVLSLRSLRLCGRLG